MKRTQHCYLCLLMGLFYPLVSLAQESEETEKKKPSWSTGLPERKTAPSMNAPVTEVGKPDFEMAEPETIEMPESDMELTDGLNNEFTMPQITIDNSLSEEVEPEPEPEPVVESKPIETSDVQYEVYAATDSSVNRNSSLAGDYQWEIIKMKPVKVPKTLLYKAQDVMLEITINPLGEVVKVNRVDKRLSDSIFKYANHVIKKWRFEAPESAGIDSNISQTMRVELQPR